MLIVEDGAGKPDSESYCSVGFADQHFSDRGNAAWAALSVEAKEAALRLATDYMGQAYRSRWPGARVSAAQALDWPRSGVSVDGFPVAADVVPMEVQRACAMLADRATQGSLSPDRERGVLSESIGEISIQYDPSSPQHRRYTEIDNLLAPLIGGGQIRLVRA